MAFDKNTGDEVWRSLMEGLLLGTKVHRTEWQAIAPGVDRRLVRGFRTEIGRAGMEKEVQPSQRVINVADPVVDKSTGRIFLTFTMGPTSIN